MTPRPHHGIQVTSPLRTILDCATVLADRSLERLTDEAEYLGLMTRSSLRVFLEEHGGFRGASRLRDLLDHHAPGTTRTRSPLEESFLLLVRGAGLPQPEVNARLGPYEIDFLWRRQGVAVETDGRRSHQRATQRERDARRDAWLHAHAYTPLRFTWHQVLGRPEEVLGALRSALGLKTAA